MPAFVPGIELNRHFFEEIVRPILDQEYTSLQYAAARIGPGSETLGFDTEMSMDHDWGLHFFIFLKDEDAGRAGAIDNMLSLRLPLTYSNYPVSLPISSQTPRFLSMRRPLDGPAKHHIVVTTTSAFMLQHLAYDLTQPLRPVDWLTIPAHSLGEAISGSIYHDGPGELTALRATLSWYPRDVWLYLLAAGWQRIGQEEHLMPRAGIVGDEFGSALAGSRLARDVATLCFLIERQYAPYAKWFGTGFHRLNCAPKMEPLL